MSRNVGLSLSFLCLALIAVMAMSCGGSSPGSTACTGGPYDVVGDWLLTLSGSGSSTSVLGPINSAGLAVLFQPGPPVVTVTMPPITGACSLTGTGTAYIEGGTTASETVQGNVNSATSISGKITNSSGTYTLSMVPSTPLTGSVTALTGSGWHGNLEGTAIGIFSPLTFTATGSGQSMSVAGGTGCSVSGTFTQETGNVFDVSLTFSGTGCPVPSLSGLGFESSSDYFTLNGGAAGTYLYAISSSGAEVLEVFKPAT